MLATNTIGSTHDSHHHSGAAPLRTSVCNILIVDSHPIVRCGLASLFSREPDFEVAGETGSCAEALRMFHQSRPQVVTVEVLAQDGSGLELIRDLAAIDSRTSVIVFSCQSESLFAERALRAGAKGFISKNEPIERIVSAVRGVLEGRIHLSEQMTERMLLRSINGNGTPTTNPIATLSDRELEVFEQLGQGNTTRSIAASLRLSPKTVETYRENIKGKLNLRNAMELTQHAVQWVLERR